ncbi:MAG TPA: cell division FtsA domain-containing protein [Negativicutes bacterium]|nr:cell division FtsA domain-containing protein [Negativicutes bacterium]
MEKKLLFALDIGTRSIVGLIGEKIDQGIRVLGAVRHEHTTRAMLDGQIHDVPEVAKVIRNIKLKLEKDFGPLHEVAIAAAGRALSTLNASAELDVHSRGYLTLQEERTLELTAIQSAQKQLATSRVVNDPASYYCVGHSIVNFSLDGTIMKTLVGQRGHKAAVEIISTFLPRQVIDSLQAAVLNAGLEIGTLTLEPIAAINVLIPPTMRHLNLVLVDVGAGTSDVAVTRNGSVVGYGMVPIAGDEITEELSGQHLLDFKVAETLKRRLGRNVKHLNYVDILGLKHSSPPEDIIRGITPAVTELAQAIAAQILLLNNSAPQAILLVGGGALTPLLPEILAQIMDMPKDRVAVRRPDAIEDIQGVTADLCTPDAVTPLGILKIAGAETLNFLNVVLNEQPLRLFNLGGLTVGDALLAAGIDARSLAGRSGLGITLTINEERIFLPGSLGQIGQLTINGQPANFSDPVGEGDVILVEKGMDGQSPNPCLAELVDLPPPLLMELDGKPRKLSPLILVNDHPVSPDEKLDDRDQVVWSPVDTVDRAFQSARIPLEPKRFVYTVNDTERVHTVWPTFSINGQAAESGAPVAAGDHLRMIAPATPSVSDVIGFRREDVEPIEVIFNGITCTVPTRRYTLTMNGVAVELTEIAPEGSTIDFTVSAESQPTLADVLLAAEFNPSDVPATGGITVVVNNKVAEYTAFVKNGDKIDIVMRNAQRQ